MQFDNAASASQNNKIVPMHTFTNIEKRMLQALRDQDVKDIRYLGATIKDIFFPSHECALYMEPSNKKAFLFFPAGKHLADRESFASLISLVTFIEYLKKENLIYLQPAQMQNDILFYENYNHSFLFGESKQADVKHIISKQEYIRMDLSSEHSTIEVPGMGAIPVGKLQSDRLFITDAAGNRHLESTNVDSLFDKLYELLCGRAFPTETLSRFISNGYCTDEEKRNKRALRISWGSFIVAFIALVLTSPLVTTCYTNKKGYTTIEQHQFDTLKTIISASISVNDTISPYHLPIDEV